MTDDIEKERIREVVQGALDAAFNEGNVELMAKFFHPGFVYLTVSKNTLTCTPIPELLQSVREEKASGGYPPAERASWRITCIEATGTAAVVKLDFFRGERRTCTDFFSLYKFEEGWRLVSQTVFHHAAGQ